MSEHDGSQGSAGVAEPSTEPSERASGLLSAVSNEVVRLHKEQFGRGPTRSRSHFVGRDTLICLLGNTMTPAEHKLVSLNESLRVMETRLALQAASADEFKESIGAIVGREVVGFMSAIDPATDTVTEVFLFAPSQAGVEGI
jgi:uncharacterized protein YbcI